MSYFTPFAAPPLELIGSRTLAHYQQSAEAFWTGTRDHDVTENVSALLDALGGERPHRILDLGCGPGRDLMTFRVLGHDPVGLDGCAEFVRMARAHSGCEVLHQNFFELTLGGRSFDGVFANASLFHLPQALMPRVLAELRGCLRAGGVLFCSNPRSFEVDSEGWHGQRYGAYLTVASWTALISEAGFVLERTFLRPSGRPPEEQPWLAMVWRKPEA